MAELTSNGWPDDQAVTGQTLPSPAMTNTVPEPTTLSEQAKHRPPYRPLSPKRSVPAIWRGSCHCKRATYSLYREKPLDAKFCHCRGCQIMHGAPLQWAAIFPKEDVAFAQGATGLDFYSSHHRTDEYEIPTKVFCSYCRTPIMDEGARTCLLFPELIDLSHYGDDDSKKRRELFGVSCHIFYSARIVDIHDGKPKWAGMNEESDLLDDDGNLVKKWSPPAK